MFFGWSTFWFYVSSWRAHRTALERRPWRFIGVVWWAGGSGGSGRERCSTLACFMFIL